MTTWEQLQQAFLADHRAMLRGFQELINALVAGDRQASGRAASELNAVAGPHIEFEERFLYPQVARTRGDTYLSRLYDEHDEVVAVLADIIDGSETAPHEPRRLDRSTVSRWVATLRGGIDHASACGTLLGELKSLSEPQQLEFLDRLNRLRDRGNCWTELNLHAAALP